LPLYLPLCWLDCKEIEILTLSRFVDELPHEEVEGVDEGPAGGGAQHQQQQDAVRSQEHPVPQELNMEVIRNTPYPRNLTQRSCGTPLTSGT
jgi:hypothetical protein